MIICLHGPNSFQSRTKLRQLVEQFKKQRDPRGDNVVMLEGEKLTIDELNAKTAARSLLAQKRLIIIEGLFGHREEAVFKDLLDYLKKVEKQNDNVLIFYENSELDATTFGAKKLTVARKKLFDYLNGQRYSEKFKQLTPVQLRAWIEKNISEHGLAIAPAEVAKLTSTLENDSWHIHNEVEKLIHFVQGQKRQNITSDDVAMLTRGRLDDNIFSLTDAVSNNNRALFFTLLEGQLESGIAFQQILIMLTRQFKIILQIKELLLAQKNQKEIIAATKLHPFVVQKTTPQTRNFNVESLKSIISELIAIDYKTKTGQADGLTSLALLFAK
jgi:DNA polymerase-3 subunit delta